MEGFRLRVEVRKEFVDSYLSLEGARLLLKEQPGNEILFKDFNCLESVRFRSGAFGTGVGAFGSWFPRVFYAPGLEFLTLLFVLKGFLTRKVIFCFSLACLHYTKHKRFCQYRNGARV